MRVRPTRNVELTGPDAPRRPPTSGPRSDADLQRSVPGEVLEGGGLVGAGLAGEAEHPLAEDVFLDLLGAAADPDRPLVEEQLLPEAGRRGVVHVQHPARALERQREVAVARDPLTDRELHHRRFGTVRLPGPRRRARSLPEPLEDLEAGVALGQLLAHDRVLGLPAVLRELPDGLEREARHPAAD